MKVPFHENPVQNGRTNEWRKEAMEFSAFLYTHEHTPNKSHLTFLLSLFLRVKPGWLENFTKKNFRGLGA